MGATVLDRFWPKVAVADVGCWDWTGALNNMGYGVFHRPGTANEVVLAHRFAYEQEHGPIPEGLRLDHLCSNPECVKPDHLEPVTQSENVRRGRNSTRLPHGDCANGHPYRESRTRTRCATCHQKAERARASHKQEV